MKLHIDNHIIFVLLLIVPILVFQNCSNDKYYSSPEEVIQANIDFMNTENIEGTLSTIHPDSPAFESTEKLIDQLFKVYDLNCKLEKLAVIDENNEEAVVNFTQVTTKLKGPKFKDTRIKGTHQLKKDGDSWKIYSTKILDTEFLN